MRLSAIQPIVKSSALVFLLFSVHGCVNLEAIRDYYNQSAALTASTQALDYNLAWNERRPAYVEIAKKFPSKSSSGVSEVDEPKFAPLDYTKKQVDALKSLNDLLARYMAQLAALADEDFVKVDANVDGLVKNLNDLPNVGEEKEKVNAAYGAVLKLIKLPLEAWRQYELKKLVVESDPDIQVLARVLYKETKLTANDIKAEGVEVNNWIRRMSYRDSTKSFYGSLNVEEIRRAKLNATNEKANAAYAAAESIKRFGVLHGEMAKDLSSFNSKQMKILIANVKAAKTELEKTRQQYKDAFKSQ